MTRHASVIRLRSEKEAEYRDLHRAVWPEVLAQIERSNIRNYSIFLHDGLLIAYFEYVGDNFERDMKLMAQDPRTQEWWKLTDPCQLPLTENEKWTPIEEVFHCD